MKKIDITGQRFNRIVVIKESTIKLYGRSTWECLCDCGTKFLCTSDNLRRGKQQSCNCLRDELNLKRSITHGFDSPKDKNKQRFYNIFKGVLSRCFNPHRKAYPNYGGRGVTVGERWLGEHGFENFVIDMYESYLAHVKLHGVKNTTIDRFPNKDGNYELGNCRWADWPKQQRNRRNSSNVEDYEEHKKWQIRLEQVIVAAMKEERKTSKYEKYFGCTLPEFRQYIESLWEPWMNWDNYGRGGGKWVVDHKKQCREFDLAKEDDRYLCFNYKNLRPYSDKKNTEEQYRITVTK